MRKRFILGLLLVIGLYASFLEWRQLSDIISAPTTTTDRIPAFYIHNIARYRFNDAGELTSTLRAQTALRLQDEPNITFQQPRLDMQQQGRHWQLTADTAAANDENAEFHLHGAVTLSSDDGKAKITGERLVFDSARQYAYSDSPTRIQINGSITDAGRMKIDLQNEEIQLQNGVETHYVPKTVKRPATQPQP